MGQLLDSQIRDKKDILPPFVIYTYAIELQKYWKHKNSAA